MRCDDSFNLHCQSEGNQFRNHDVHATAKGNAEVNAQHLSISSVNQEILEVTIADSNEIRRNTKYSDAFNELVFNSEKRSRG